MNNRNGYLNDMRVFTKRRFSPQKKEALYLMLLFILVAVLAIWVSLYDASGISDIFVAFEAVVLMGLLASFVYYRRLNKKEHEAVFLLCETGGGDTFWSNKRVVELLDL